MNLLILLLIGCVCATDSILLRDVESLVFNKYVYARGRRSFPIPQLSCVGGSAFSQCNKVDLVLCQNVGFDGRDVVWKCETNIGVNLKLGQLFVSCEGYQNPDDPYVLVGSCALEFNLEYTEKYYNEQRENERKENERKDNERLENERRENERHENERRENERRENEKRENKRKENEKRENERRENERRKNDPQYDAYLKEIERKEVEKRENERKETEKRENERRENERKENERKEYERSENERKKLINPPYDEHPKEMKEKESVIEVIVFVIGGLMVCMLIIVAPLVFCGWLFSHTQQHSVVLPPPVVPSIQNGTEVPIPSAPVEVIDNNNCPSSTQSTTTTTIIHETHIHQDTPTRETQRPIIIHQHIPVPYVVPVVQETPTLIHRETTHKNDDDTTHTSVSFGITKRR